MNPKYEAGLLARALEKGRAWISGEMEFDVTKGAKEAFRQACYIAEQCGYLVSWLGNGFQIVGGDISGFCTVTFEQDKLKSIKFSE